MAVALPARHRLAKRRSVPISALSNEDFVLVPRDIGPGFFDMVIAACVAAGFSPRIRHQARHLLTTLSLVATSGAVSLVPETLARASLPGVAPLVWPDSRFSFRRPSCSGSFTWPWWPELC